MKHIPRKRFGQNFLTDQGVIDSIVAAIDPKPGEIMVEIGPGLAAMTAPIVERLGHMHVVEIDRDIVSRLQGRFSPKRLSIHQGDALAFDFGALGPDLRVVGNLPYNISTPLLFHLAGFADQVRDMHFMLQKEVVERMVAAPATADYGRLSVMLQYRFHMALLFIVPPEAFDPPPKVESAIVRMQPKPKAELCAIDEDLFAKVVAAAFSQRRKMLRNTLRELIAEEQLADLGIKPTARAEDIALADYLRLANHLAS